MRISLPLLQSAGLIALLALPAAAQNTPPPSGTSGAAVAAAQVAAPSAFVGTLGAFPGIMFGAGLQSGTGKPFSAEQITEGVQTLADGTRITQSPQKTLIYRDSAGRTRTEHIFTPPPGVTMVSGPSFIEIADPVAGFRYMLNGREHTAQRMPYQPARRHLAPTLSTTAPGGAPSGSAVPQQPNQVVRSGAFAASVGPPAVDSAGRPHPDMSHESLGTQNIDGVTADGTRMTIIYPEGFMGNDRPLTVVRETWTSPDLKMVVLSKVSDPRNGDSTTRLENVSQTEPDPALFQVPSDYTVTEMPQSNAATISFEPSGVTAVHK